VGVGGGGHGSHSVVARGGEQRGQGPRPVRAAQKVPEGMTDRQTHTRSMHYMMIYHTSDARSLAWYNELIISDYWHAFVCLTAATSVSSVSVCQWTGHTDLVAHVWMTQARWSVIHGCTVECSPLLFILFTRHTHVNSCEHVGTVSAWNSCSGNTVPVWY